MALSDIIAVMPPATWYELPGTALSGAYAITDTQDPRYGVKGPKSVPEDWCGGAFDTENNLLLLHGGWHESYGGNEVYAFSLDTLAWTHNTPSTYVDDGGGSYHTTDDAPVSAHTYDGLQCIPGTNLMFKVGGANWETGNNYDTNAYLYDTVNKTWAKKAAPPIDITEPATAYDASRHCIWVLERNNMLRYDITPDTWTIAQGGLPSQTNYTMAYDPVNDRLVRIGSSDPATVAYYDCANGGGLQAVTLTGDSFSTYQAAIAYDSTRSMFVSWNGTRAVVSIDPNTWVVTQINAATGVAPQAPANDYHGTYSKWQYVPNHDVFIAYAGAEQNVWIYKAGTAGSGPSAGWGDPQRVVAVSPATGKVTGSHTGFNVLLTRANLPDEMFDPSGSLAAQVNGGDVRITADAAGTIRLPIDMQPGFALDSATGAGDGKAEIWTKLPSFSQGTNVYVWYHSESTQVQPSEGDPYGRNAVWSDLIAGWHLNAAGSVEDITGGGATMTLSGVETKSGPYAGGALKLNYAATGDSLAIDADQAYTVSWLISRDTTFTADTFLSKVGATSNPGCTLRTDTITTAKILTNDNAGTSTYIATSMPVSTTGWTRISLASPVGVGTQIAYQDGVSVGSVSTPRQSGGGIVAIRGGATSLLYATLFIRKGLSSADWMATEDANQTDPDTFFVAGVPETPVNLTTVTAETAYAIRATLAAGTTWSIHSKTAKPTAWAINVAGLETVSTGWAINTRRRADTAWAIITDTYARIERRETAWRIGPRWLRT